MDKKGRKEETISGVIVSILVFIGILVVIIWAFSNGGSSETDKVILEGASYLFGLTILFLILMGALILFIILVKKAREEGFSFI